MKIFSNFDTDMDKRLYWKAVKRFGKQNVMLIHRDKIYFWFNIFLPAFLFLFVSGICIILWFYYEVNNTIWRIIFWIIILWAIPLKYNLLIKYLDYRMDFCLVTPIEISFYNQSWVFSRNSRSLNTSKLKTITSSKAWFFRGLLNFGSMRFLTEWNDEAGEIELTYIKDPDRKRGKINKIISKYYDFKTKPTNN